MGCAGRESFTCRPCSSRLPGLCCPPGAEGWQSGRGRLGSLTRPTPTLTLGVQSAGVFQTLEVSERCLCSLDTASRCFQKLALRVTAIVRIVMRTFPTGRGLFSFAFHFTVDALKMLKPLLWGRFCKVCRTHRISVLDQPTGYSAKNKDRGLSLNAFYLPAGREGLLPRERLLPQEGQGACAQTLLRTRSLPGPGCPRSAVWLALLCNDQGVPHGKQRGSLCLWNPRSSLRAASLVKSNKQTKHLNQRNYWV